MPQPAENLTYDSLLEAANPAYPWTPPMSNAAVPVGNGALTYTPRLHREKAALWGVDIAFDITAPAGGIDPNEPYPAGGGELISVALGTGTFLGGVPLTVEAGPRLARMAAYFVPPGVPLDKATHQRMTKQVVPGMTQSIVIGDARVVNAMAIAPTRGRLWSSSAGKFTHGINTSNKAMTSVDGINWHGTITPAADTDCAWVCLAYSPALNRIVALASAGTNRAMSSDDGGDTWTQRTISASAWRSVVWSPTLALFVLGGSSASANTFWSTDGIAFSQTGVTKPTTINVRAICWSPELAIFVSVGDIGTGQRAMTSADGKTWTARNTAADNAWLGICWSPELRLFVAVANTGTQRVMTSPDGANWTIRASADETAGWGAVCWSPERNLFVAVATSGSNRVMTSPDGITWKLASVSAAGIYADVKWCAALGLFVAIGSSGAPRLITSPDGVVWTERTNFPAASSWQAVIYIPTLGRLVAVSSTFATNPETLTWPIGIAPGEVWRGQVNVTAIGGAGGVSVLACDPQREIFVSPGITVTGKVLFKVTPTQIANRLGFSCLTTGSADLVAQDAAAFKETPLCAPQGLWDVHVFGVDADGVEDTAGVKYTNVTVV